MAKKKRVTCPPPPGGCGGKGWVEDDFNGQKKKSDCFTCHGSGTIEIDE